MALRARTTWRAGPTSACVVGVPHFCKQASIPCFNSQSSSLDVRRRHLRRAAPPLGLRPAWVRTVHADAVVVSEALSLWRCERAEDGAVAAQRGGAVVDAVEESANAAAVLELSIAASIFYLVSASQRLARALPARTTATAEQQVRRWPSRGRPLQQRRIGARVGREGAQHAALAQARHAASPRRACAGGGSTDLQSPRSRPPARQPPAR